MTQLFRGQPVTFPAQVSPRVLVAGRGPALEMAVRALVESGFSPLPLRPEEGRLVGLAGLPGRFRAFLEADGRIRIEPAAAVVLAFAPAAGPVSDPAWAGLGRTIGPEDAPEEALAGLPQGCLAVVAGFWSHLEPEGFGQALDLALAAQARGEKVFVFLPQAKVAGPGLEEKYLSARQAGVVFTRLDQPPRPAAGPAGLRLEFLDPILAETVGLTATATLALAPCRPDPDLAAAAQALGLQAGPDGWPIPDNVLYPAPLTGRAGVLALAGARGPESGRLAADSALLPGALDSLLRPAGGSSAVRINAWRGTCAQCLTCLRVCPVGAIAWEDGPVVLEAACLKCGQCASICPVNAIRPAWDEEAGLGQALTAPGGGTVFLACRRLPEEALAALPGEIKTVRLNCAGRVSEEVLLGLLRAGFARVVVAACHSGNCRSQNGADRARAVVEFMSGQLESWGGGAGRIKFLNLAPNQAHRLAELAGLGEEA